MAVNKIKADKNIGVREVKVPFIERKTTFLYLAF